MNVRRMMGQNMFVFKFAVLSYHSNPFHFWHMESKFHTHLDKNNAFIMSQNTTLLCVNILKILWHIFSETPGLSYECSIRWCSAR